MTDNSAASTRRFVYFIVGSSLTSFAMGLHSLLFPWLLVGILGVAPDSTGFAMMLSTLPSTFLLLWAGAFSDGRHLGSLLLRLYGLLWVPHLMVLASLFWWGWSYPVVILYAVLFGVVISFIQPARESLLGEVALLPLHASVAKTLMAQYAGMIAGAVLGGVLMRDNVTIVIVLQMALFAAAGCLLFASSPRSEVSRSVARTRLSDVVSGIQLSWTFPLLRHLLLMVAVTGVLGMGFYFVLLPLLTREVYMAGAGFLAGLQVSFLLGGICCSLVVMRKVDAFPRPGRALIYATILRGVLLILMSANMPAWVVFACIFCWGVLSGLATMVGRTMAQDLSPVEYRGRVLSIYQLALFGTVPLGALGGGFLMNYLGVLQTTALLGGFSILVGVLYILSGNILWKVREGSHELVMK